MKCVKPFGSVNAHEHLHKAGYKKALQEALITMAKREKETKISAIDACNEPKQAAQSNRVTHSRNDEKSHVGTIAWSDIVVCDKKKSKSASDVQSACVEGRITRSQVAKNLNILESSPVIHIKKKPMNKREMKKMKNSVRRSERLRQKKLM